MPQFRPTALPDVIEITPDLHEDKRGFVSEVFNARTLLQGGITCTFVQDNHSYSRAVGVLRGLHYQVAPFEQAKLVRVTHGHVFDVAVDIRRDSSTFGKWIGVELSADKWNQLFVPVGFAHGFVTLTPGVELLYKVSNYYSPDHERCIRYDDPAIGIHWPLPSDSITLSSRDSSSPSLWDADIGKTAAEQS